MRVQGFRDYLRLADGSTQLNVDGSVEPVNATIVAQAQQISIYEVRFILQAANLSGVANGRKWTNAYQNGLPNGLQFSVGLGGVFTNWFVTPVKRIADFQCHVNETIDIQQGVAANVDLFVAIIRAEFVPFTLEPGLADELRVTVQDDLTTMTGLQVLVTGYRSEAS